MRADRVEMLVSLRYGAERLIHCNDEEDCLLTIVGSIHAQIEHPKGHEVEIKLGVLEMFLVQVEHAMASQFWPGVLDAHQSTTDIGCVLFDSSYQDYNRNVKRTFDGDVNPWDDFLILERLILEPAVRGQGLALAILDQAIHDWSRGCSLVAMKPFPLQYLGGGLDPAKKAELKVEGFRSGKAESFRRLRAYYAKLGFKRVGRTDVYALCTHLNRPSLEAFSLPAQFTLPKNFVERHLASVGEL